MARMKTIGAMLPTGLQVEFESLRVECLGLINKRQRNRTESARVRVIFHRMTKIIDSQPGLRQEAQHIEEMVSLLRQVMDAD
jgi:hypothetical protein